MDYTALFAEALPSVVALGALALNAAHVRNAQNVSADLGRIMADAMAAMHGNFTGLLGKLVTAAPTLAHDAAAVVADVMPAAVVAGGVAGGAVAAAADASKTP